MRKSVLIIVALLTLFIAMPINATDGDTPVVLKVKQTNPGGEHTPPAKGPVMVPTTYLDGNILSFDASLEGCTVQLLDEDEDIIFSDFIGVNQTSLTFPSTLTGTYELQIVCGSITFYCNVEL